MSTVVVECFIQGGYYPKTVTLQLSGPISAEIIAEQIHKLEGIAKPTDHFRRWCGKAIRKVTISGEDVVIDAIGPNRSGFRWCFNLEELTIDASVISITDNAFWNCFTTPSSLRTVILAGKYGTIGKLAFAGCKALTHIELPNGLRSIGERAFSGCEQLREVVLPPSIQSIEVDSFDDCPATLVIDAHRAGGFEDLLANHAHETVAMSEDGVRSLAMSHTVDAESGSEVSRIAASAPSAGTASAESVSSSDPESLLKYLKAVSTAESHVFQISEELADCLGRRKTLEAAKRRTTEFEASSQRSAAKRREASRKLWEKERWAISEGLRLSSEDKRWIGVEPSDPHQITGPVKPERPTLEKPGLFNRRKVEKRNAELEKEYQEAMVRYDRAMDALQQRIDNYEEELKSWRERRDTAIKAQLAQYGSFEDDTAEVEEQNSSISIMLAAVSDANEALCDELRKRLIEASGLLKAIYSADVVFPKYRNLAAMTTMYEYFETGRCSSLQGPDGAYNLYESEVRQNAIIAKLDIVSTKLDIISDKLDQIQQNQYVLYTAIEGANRRLDEVSQTLGEVLDVARSTNDMVQGISAKASAIVANSANTAHWARKNAELTDSLGYLIAFKSF